LIFGEVYEVPEFNWYVFSFHFWLQQSTINYYFYLKMLVIMEKANHKVEKEREYIMQVVRATSGIGEKHKAVNYEVQASATVSCIWCDKCVVPNSIFLFFRILLINFRLSCFYFH